MSEAGSLYEKYGGEGTIKALVENFYQRVTGDNELAPFFTNVDMGRLKRHQALFISQALGGPKQYDGRDMAIAHAGLSITNAHFDRVAGHLVEAMEELGVEEDDIEAVVAVVGPLRAQVVTAQDAGEAIEETRLNEVDMVAVGSDGSDATLPHEAADQPQSLYDKLGGSETVKAVVEEFYRRVLGDGSLAPVFNGLDMGRLKRHQALFFSQALGGPKQYDGRDMYEAHKKFLITDAQFDAVAGHLVGTLQHFNVGQQDIDTVVGVVAPLRRYIVMDHFRRWLRGG